MVMESEQQFELVKSLDRLLKKIRLSKDKEEISLLGRESIRLAAPIPPFVHDWMKNKNYPRESKEMAMKQIWFDIKNIEENNNDWKYVHFQLSGSIAMLILKFVEGGVDRANEIID